MWVGRTDGWVQWGESSPAKHGGAYISAVVWSKILTITEKAIGMPQTCVNSVIEIPLSLQCKIVQYKFL